MYALYAQFEKLFISNIRKSINEPDIGYEIEEFENNLSTLEIFGQVGNTWSRVVKSNRFCGFGERSKIM